MKIDGSFIAGLESTQGINRLVVETVIHMAHSLGMSAIVEWVETAAQVEIVRGFDADAAQGFFFSRPMSSDDAVAFAAGPDVPQFSRTTSRSLVVVTAGDEKLVSLDGDAELDVAVDLNVDGLVEKAMADLEGDSVAAEAVAADAVAEGAPDEDESTVSEGPVGADGEGETGEVDPDELPAGAGDDDVDAGGVAASSDDAA